MKQKLKRKLISAVFIIVCFLLQTTLFQKISMASIAPNLLIVITSSFGFMRGNTEGLFIGFFSGLLLDVFSGGILGFYTMIYMVIGYVNGFFKRVFYDEDVKLPLVLIAASEFACGLMIYMFQFMLRGDFQFWFYFSHIIIPELVYTILVTIILYQIILQINRRLEAEEKRSASKFV